MSFASPEAARELNAVAARSTEALVHSVALRRGMAAARATLALAGAAAVPAARVGATGRRLRACAVVERSGEANRRLSTQAVRRRAGLSLWALPPPRAAAAARSGAHRGRRRARCGPPASHRRPRQPGWRLHMPLRAAVASSSGAARRWALGCFCPRGGAPPCRLADCGCRPAAVAQVVTRIRRRSATGATLAPMLAAAASRLCPKARR